MAGARGGRRDQKPTRFALWRPKAATAGTAASRSVPPLDVRTRSRRAGMALRSVELWSATRTDEARERLAVVGEIAAEVAHELRNVLQVISASAYVARQEADRASAAALPHSRRSSETRALAHAHRGRSHVAGARRDRCDAEPVLLAEVVVAARAEIAAGAATGTTRSSPATCACVPTPGLLARLLHVLYENAIHASAPRARPRSPRARASTAGRVAGRGRRRRPGRPARHRARASSTRWSRRGPAARGSGWRSRAGSRWRTAARSRWSTRGPGACSGSAFRSSRWANR